MQHHHNEAQPHFVRSRKGSGTDLASDREAQIVVCEVLKRFFAPTQWSNLLIKGRYDDLISQDYLGIRLLDRKGSVIRTLDVASCYPGFVTVRAEQGDILDCISRDIEGEVARLWLEAQGFSPGFPIGTEILMERCGGLKVELQPCF